MFISQASIEDAEAILKLQKLAYQSEAQIYNDFSIPPLTQTLDQIKADFATKVFLKAIVDGDIVGSVRGYQEKGTCYIERLIVQPTFQGQGIGTALMRHLEPLLAEAERFELFTGHKSERNMSLQVGFSSISPGFTGHKSERNIRLYQKLGYQAFKQEPVTESLTFVFMEKRGKAVPGTELINFCPKTLKQASPTVGDFKTPFLTIINSAS
jgi:ribosomal protein S18 acetylase RimI-like enzyme